MSDAPFMPLWVSDFIGDTLDLDAKEVGAYLLILMAMWVRGGYLPNDTKKLQRVARCGRDWPRVWDAIGHYFTIEGDQITQKRVRYELQKVARKREANAQNGARGGLAKSLKNIDVNVANATNSPKQPEPEPEPEVKEGGGDVRASEVSRPELVSGETHRERLLTAIGADPISGLVGPNGRRLGTQADMLIAKKWRDDLGLSEADQLGVIFEVMAKSREPPSTFRYFSPAMQRFSAEKSAPPLAPIRQDGGSHAKSDRMRFDHAHREYARRVSEGTVHIRSDESDPFAGG